LNNDSSIATRTSVLRSLQITGHLHRTISSAISGIVWAETLHQTFELARAVEDPDVGEAAYRALVDEDIGDNLPVHAPPELLERDTRRVVGRQRVEVAFSEFLRSLICPRLPSARPTVLSTPVLRMARRSSVCLATSSRLSTQ
jgi:hypothetical protein